MYSAAALRDPPMLNWITATAVGTTHWPLSGIASICVTQNASSAFTMARRQKRSSAMRS
jgi:hypothetical protein